MNVLFSLCISCITEEDYQTEYPIGIFRNIEDVNSVAKRLMSDSGRFSKPDCEANISEIEIIGESDTVECVYRFYGQNISSSEGDIIESPCYTDKSTAIQKIHYIKRSSR